MSRKIKEFGLTEVYSSPEKPPLVDIVFVHGLNGKPKDTWTSKNGVFWPAELLPEFVESLRVRILTYGYNANVASFTDGTSKDRIHHHAETLAGELHANRSLRGGLQRPIIFVCHSLGGLVVKRSIIMCRSAENDKIRHLRSIYVSTFGILFLGTPHNGSDAAKWGLLLQKICSAVFPRKFLDTSPQLVEALKTRNETLQNINRLFNDSFSRFHIYFFHETKPVDLKGTREFIVEEESAAPDIEGAERMGIEADHSGMVKFEDDSSPGFDAVAEALVRYSREAPALIAGRWTEEKELVILQNRAKAQEFFDASVDVSATGNSAQADNENRMGNSMPSLPPHRFATDNSSRLSHSMELLPPQRGHLFVVPAGFHPNETFVGMEKELGQLHARLFKAKSRSERLTAVLICGVSGSGKTHLAREYVHRYRKDYPGGIFWVDAKPVQAITTCFWDIAQAAMLTSEESKYSGSTDASQYVDEIRHWFENREEWLLIFDGLSFDEDGQINNFKKYLPFSKNSSIIYTSVDRTLAKKQRLFGPYCLTVRPLEVEDARHLLFNHLGIKKPTAGQLKKATEIVNHYQCLPLAIHAISHRLVQNGKPLEKYHINSHLTDQRLAEPFLGIMHDLYDQSHFEALTLINVLAFFGHRVPVGLVSWGRSALEPWKAGILTSSRPGEPGDIDTTLGILIQCGLIERVSDPYPGKSLTTVEDDNKARSPEEGPATLDSSGSFTDNSQEAVSVYQSSIDVIKIHSVVQDFCRDELKVRDEEMKANNRSLESQSQDIGCFVSWLVVATKVLCRSYENARSKMKNSTDLIFIKDYHEYETHAERITDHFRKVDLSPPIVREARESLKDMVKDIKKEVVKISPNASEESFRHEKSIFDRSSSSSSGPSSSVEENMSRRSTWNADDSTFSEVETPQNMDGGSFEHHEQVRFHLYVPHIYRETNDDDRDDGYLTDREDGRASVRHSPSPSQMSQGTETTEKPTGSGDEQGWETVKKKPIKPAGHAHEKRSRYRGRLNYHDLGSYRPIPTLPKLSSAQGEGSISRPSEASTRSAKHTKTSIKSILAPYYKASLSGGEQTADNSPFSSATQKENQPTWANIAAVSKPVTGNGPTGEIPRNRLGLKTELSQGTLSNNSSIVTSSPSGDFKNNYAFSHSVPALVREPRPEIGDARSAPGSRLHSRHPSTVIDPNRTLSSSPPRRFQEWSLADLSYNQKIAMTSQRRVRSPQQSSLPGLSTPVYGQSPVAHPSAFMPGSSPPTGYTSEPVSAPMSRDPSGQSHDSWQTEPTPYSPSISHAPAMGHGHHVPPPEFMPASGSRPPSFPPYPVRGRGIPLPPVSDGPDRTRFDYGGEPESTQRILFGEHEVDVNQARRRVVDWNLRQAGTDTYLETPRNLQRTPRPSVSGSNLGSVRADARPSSIIVPASPNGRLRAGSCPPQPDYPGLGLQFDPQNPVYPEGPSQ